ncbi:MAG: hypothetical protein PHH82_01350 [Candidatus ainarchaeum sp.]|nr:hypothetical protein [Candidatus ainarchaeum sp.]
METAGSRGNYMPKPYKPERHLESVLKRKQTNSVDLRLKSLLERAKEQGASRELMHSLLESAIRIKDNRFHAPRAKGPEKKLFLSKM